MGVGGLAESVTVSGATPVIETSRSSASSTVNEIAVQNLPVNGRNFIDFALLTPGVTRDTRTGDISFAGQRGTLNSLVIDGADSNNTFFGQTIGRTGSGRAPYQFSQDAVKEFQVNSNAFSAEYGRAGGAVINVVTKSGTNDLHGSAFEFYRDKALNANNAINVLNNRPKSPYHYNQFGGTLGGPIRKNRDFFFGNYDGQRNTQPNIVFLNLPSTTPGDPATQAAIAQLTPLAASWNRTLDQDVFLIKTDHQLNVGNRLSLRYNQQNFTGEGFENGGAQNSLEHTGASLVKTRSFNAAWTSIVGARLFNEMRLQLSRDEEPGEANSANPEAVIQQSGTTVLTIGRNNFSPRETTIERWQIADTLTIVRGTHKVKTGFDFQFDDILNRFPGFFSGSYTFRSLASLRRRTARTARTSSYQQNFAGPDTTGAVTHPNIHEYSFFAQDEWKPRRDVTINAGLRYDLMRHGAAAGAQSGSAARCRRHRHEPVRCRHQQLRPAPRHCLEPARPAIRGARRLGALLRTDAVDHARHGALEQRRQHRVAHLHRRRRADLSAVVRHDSVDRRRVASDHLLYRPGFRQRAADAGQRGHRVAALSRIRRSPPPICSWTATSCHARSTATSARPARATFTLANSTTTFAYPFLGADRPFGNFQRVIAFESTAVSRYNGLTLELNQPLLERRPVSRRLHAGQGRRHRPRCDSRRAGQCRRRCEVRVEPG